MEKGFVFYKRPTLAPDLYNYVWFNAMVGKLNVLNEDGYGSVPAWKRGLIHTPSLKGATIQENGSFFKELLDILQVSSVNLGAPVLIDMFEGDVAYRINGKLDLVAEYVGYIKEHWTGLEKKPLLRLNQGQWDAYCTDNLSTTLKLLDVVDILVASPNSALPPLWNHLLEVKWFEFYTGIIAHDETGNWLESPANPEVVVDVPVGDEPAGDEPSDNEPTGDILISEVNYPTKTTIRGKYNIWTGNVDLEVENFFDE